MCSSSMKSYSSSIIRYLVGEVTFFFIYFTEIYHRFNKLFHHLNYDIMNSILPPKFKNTLFFCICILFSTFSFGQTISSFSPNVVTRGTQVTITGSGFNSTTVVKFGGTTVANILPITSTEIRVLVTTGATGAVTVKNGASPLVTAVGSITYITPSTTPLTAAVTRVVTDFEGYWSSASTALNTTLPDNRHNLTAFTYNGTLYSTGVNDASLTSHSDTFAQRVFKAFSTDGITGNTGTSSANYIALGSKVDGNTSAANYLSPAVAGLTVRDVLIDGINGLDLGTGVTNVTSSMVMAYKVSNIVLASINDNEPDVIITQTAEPTNTNADVYSFIDANGNVVGNSISANLSQIPHVGTYKLDLFRLPDNVPYEIAVPNGNADSNTKRDIRLIAFKLSEFGINASNYAQVDKFKLMPSGSSDPAFIAYNANSFLISVPTIVENPVSAIICTGTSTSAITFSVTATGPDLTYQWKKNNTNIIGATASTYTIANPAVPADLASYSVVISNVHGSVISSPATIILGTGTSEWNGSAWIGGTPTAQKNIVFNGSYTSTGNLTGCSCTVNNGTVTLLANHTMIIENQVEVIPEAVLILNDAASLVQINNGAVNTGNIKILRDTQPVRRYDYTYWSSPVSPQSLINLSPDTFHNKFHKFDAILNNWVVVPGTTLMEKGIGYIVRAPQSNSLTVPAVYNAAFVGVPNNGIVTVPVQKGITKSNLLGNPYPSGLNAELFLSDPANKSSIGGTIYLWTHATAAIGGVYNDGDYAKWNLTGSVKATSPTIAKPTGIIASGQSFFVEGAPGAGASNAVFKNYMRATSGNSQFYRQSNAVANSHSEKHRFWLNLQNDAGAFNQMLVGYLNEATNQYDRDFDGRIFGGNATLLYSILEDEKLAIQGRSLLFYDTETIRLGYTATTAGNLSIVLEQFDGVFQNQDIYLKDNLLEITHDLKNAQYNFATNEGTFDNRFEIVYKSELLNIENPSWNTESVIIYKKEKTLFINAGNTFINEIRLFDLQGRLVYENENINATKTEINSLPTSGQVFIVQVKNAEGHKITKKIIY